MVSDMITPGYYNNKNTLFSQPKSETKAGEDCFYRGSCTTAHHAASLPAGIKAAFATLTDKRINTS